MLRSSLLWVIALAKIRLFELFEDINGIIFTAKESILYNSLIISTYKIGKRKRVTIWLLLKFPGLP